MDWASYRPSLNVEDNRTPGNSDSYDPMRMWLGSPEETFQIPSTNYVPDWSQAGMKQVTFAMEHPYTSRLVAERSFPQPSNQMADDAGLFNLNFSQPSVDSFVKALKMPTSSPVIADDKL